MSKERARSLYYTKASYTIIAAKTNNVILVLVIRVKGHYFSRQSWVLKLNNLLCRE